MKVLFDSVTLRFLAGFILLLASLAIVYVTHAYWFITRIDFGNVTFQIALFTQKDNWADGHKENFVVFEDIGQRISLGKLYGNTLSFWIVIVRSFFVTLDQPVLFFGSYSQRMLLPVRRYVTSFHSGMVFKRAAGFPCRLDQYQLALVYDRSEDRASYVVKGVLVKNDDINNFERYHKPRPMNSDNYRLVQKIVIAFRKRSGSFIGVRITTA